VADQEAATAVQAPRLVGPERRGPAPGAALGQEEEAQAVAAEAVPVQLGAEQLAEPPAEVEEPQAAVAAPRR